MRLMTLLGIVLVQAGALSAEPVPVRYREGTNHGFLALRTLEGKILAAGDLTQTVRKNVVRSRLIFRFRDGSVDDETATFSKSSTFNSSVTTTFRKAHHSLIRRMFRLAPLPGR